MSSICGVDQTSKLIKLIEYERFIFVMFTQISLDSRVVVLAGMLFAVVVKWFYGVVNKCLLKDCVRLMI